MEDMTKGLVKGSPGSIYPILKELKTEGLLEEDLVIEQGRAKKIYKLTSRGAQVLSEELNRFYDIAKVFIELATEARRKLPLVAKDPDKLPCPSQEVLDNLARLKQMIEEYMDTIRKRIMECREKEE
ncbi:MAG: PadR family transcriptional regulator [Desulfurococcales archaeon]|nr:PadR family transcriptional regulator [Desulfurococcales archaeon]